MRRPKRQSRKKKQIGTKGATYATTISPPPFSYSEKEREMARKFNYKVYQDLVELL